MTAGTPHPLDPIDGEYRYRSLFQAMAASFWEMDFSAVGRQLRGLIDDGVTDLRDYLETHPDFVRQAIDATLVVDVNEKTVAMFQAPSRESMLGSAGRYWPDSSEGVYAESLIAAFEHKNAFEAETRLLTLDGREIDVLFTVCWPPESRGRGTLLLGLLDLGEKREAARTLARLQAELAHAARVSLLGEMAASIAHEVNQPLAAIATNADAALRWLDRPDPPLDEVIEATRSIVTDAHRAAEIIARTRDMATRQAPLRTALEINAIVNDSLAYLAHDISVCGAVVIRELAKDLPRVLGDEVQLQQVVVNLAMNALQAMATRDGSTRRLTLRTRHSDPAGCVALEVLDTGPGLPKWLEARAFESFFTTKGAGMGMGLPITRSIVEHHGGAIEVIQADIGATVRVTLPAASS